MIWKTYCCGFKKINKKALKMWLPDFVDSYVVHLFSCLKLAQFHFPRYCH